MKLLLKVLTLLAMLACFGTANATNVETDHYTIKWGDTLSALAKDFNTTVAALAELNRISDPNKIYAGNVLRVSHKTIDASAPTNAGANSTGSQATNRAGATSQLTTAASCDITSAIDRLEYPAQVSDLFKRTDKGEAVAEVAVQTPRDFLKHYATTFENVTYEIMVTKDCDTATKHVHVHAKSANTDPLTKMGAIVPERDKEDVSRSPEETFDLLHSERSALKKFLTEAVGPPYDTRPIEDAILPRHPYSFLHQPLAGSL